MTWIYPSIDALIHNYSTPDRCARCYKPELESKWLQPVMFGGLEIITLRYTCCDPECQWYEEQYAENKSSEYPLMSETERDQFRSMRRELNVSLKDISEYSGISVSELSDYERMLKGLSPIHIATIQAKLFLGRDWLNP